MKTKEIKKISLVIDGKQVSIEHKDIDAGKVTLKAVDDEQGIIEAYVSVFGNVDSYGDIVEKGAFTDAVKQFLQDGRYPKGVWCHNWDQPIAKTLEMREDDHGLYIKGQLVLTVQQAREAYDLIKAGVMTDFSFGYSVDEYAIDNVEGTRKLTKLTIYEWSPVLVGANQATELLSVKSAAQTEKKDGEGEPAAEPSPAPAATETAPADAPKPADEPKGAPAQPQIKTDLVKAALDSLAVMEVGIKDLKQQLEAHLTATEPSKSADSGETAVDPHVKRVNNLILRDARQGVKALNKVILRLKQQ